MPVLSSFSAIQPDSLSAGKVAFAPLAQLAVLQAVGADAMTFLQGQLTQDVKAIGTHDARLAGYCTAKGRLLASGVIWQAAVTDGAAEPGYRFLVDAAVAPAFQKRLSMFVLRAKVKLATTELRTLGVTAAPAALPALESVVGALPRAAWVRAELASGTWIAAPEADGQQRWWWIATESEQEAALTALAPLAVRATQDDWQAADVAAGLPWVTLATQDLFVPQTVNLELVDGVSFTKGCYPGQEVVARSHYLGKLKRRMFRGLVDGVPSSEGVPGTDIFHSADPAQPCGRVVNAATAGAQLAMLFESTFKSLEDGTLHLGAADGPRIGIQPLPYPVAEKSD